MSELQRLPNDIDPDPSQALEGAEEFEVRFTHVGYRSRGSRTGQ
jgi:hypothetical protein